jgi:hypothetical protein
MAGKALTGEVLPARRRARGELVPVPVPDPAALAAAYAADGLPVYAQVVAETGTDPPAAAARWDAALAAWTAALVGWCP